MFSNLVTKRSSVMRRLWKRSHNTYRLAILLVAACAVLSVPLLSGAQTQTTTITIANNSSLEIRHVYLSPVNQDNWGPDQLDGTAINSGGSFTLNNISCDGASIKVISEDQNGCFLYNVVSCTNNAGWTITNEATPDCGG